MSSPPLENTMKELFHQHTTLTEAQIERVSKLESALLLAGSLHLSKVARWVRQASQQESRVEFVMRMLSAPYVSQERFYHPLVSYALRKYKVPQWHLIIDRTNLVPHVWDLLMVSLAFRKRALPLCWQILPFGCTGVSTQVALLDKVLKLVPAQQPTTLHGDTEFGAVAIMRWCQQQHWDFILSQTSHTYYQLSSDQPWYLLKALKITKRCPIYLSAIYWTKEHALGPLNLYAFYDPHQNDATSPRSEYRYQITSLPITHTLRRIGRRRWSTEPLFRDFKSAGWHLEESALQQDFTRERLLVLLSFNYLWATCIGRWLAKRGIRSHIDDSPQRRYSFFRMGLDWLIHCYVLGDPIPPMLTLYS